MNTNAQTGIKFLKKAMKDDPKYAWGWHCIIACLLMDEGIEQIAANKRAASFMKLAFNVDTLINVSPNSTDYKWEIVS